MGSAQVGSGRTPRWQRSLEVTFHLCSSRMACRPFMVLALSGAHTYQLGQGP